MTVNYRHCISLCINELFTDAEAVNLLIYRWV